MLYEFEMNSDRNCRNAFLVSKGNDRMLQFNQGMLIGWNYDRKVKWVNTHWKIHEQVQNNPCWVWTMKIKKKIIDKKSETMILRIEDSAASTVVRNQYV